MSEKRKFTVFCSCMAVLVFVAILIGVISVRKTKQQIEENNAIAKEYLSPEEKIAKEKKIRDVKEKENHKRQETEEKERVKLEKIKHQEILDREKFLKKYDITAVFKNYPGFNGIFDLDITNHSSNDLSIYIIIFGVNDSFSPPRRAAWPYGGALMTYTDSSHRGNLSHQKITRNWNSIPDTFKYKITILTGKTKRLEGILPMNKTSMHGAWYGKPISPTAYFNELDIWIFSEKGELVYKK